MKRISKKYFLTAWILVSIAGVCYLYSHLYNIHRGCDMVALNDEWEHQSMAVNFAKGYGIYKLGAYASISDYHIDACDKALPYLRTIFIKYPTSYFHRATGFSIITGTLYKLTDTRPYNLRVLNFILIICSWLIVCITFYNNRSYFYILLFLLPFFIILNFYYIDLIGDETLLIFSLSIVYSATVRWLKKTSLANSILLLVAVLFSVFIKTTLLFILFFLIIYSLVILDKNKLLHCSLITMTIFCILNPVSKKINNKHLTYQYASQTKFHEDIINADWSKEDSDFIRQNNIRFRDNINFSMDFYKPILSYLFERQFYTKSPFFLSGQSTYLLIDGNNEGCAAMPVKHTGSWSPVWKLNKDSYFYKYTTSKSASIEIIKFYLCKPYFFPIIIFFKLYAGYRWNYLFIFLSILQCFLLYLTFSKKTKYSAIVAFLAILSIHLVLILLYLVPLIVVLFCISSYLLIKKQAEQSESKVELYTAYLFILYFIFLTLALFGLNRYTCIVNSMMLILVPYLLNRIQIKLKLDEIH